ncbi:unnamed protein product [Dicrocoelium dendriticum]|nr:unnamed protein product [Dicrocoelium dendriticum]
MVRLSTNPFENAIFRFYEIFKNDVICEIACTAPAPHKDFHHLLVTTKSFTWRSWKITPRNDGAKYRPTEQTVLREDFLHDDRIQSEILRVLGPEMLDYCQKVASGRADYLVRMPTDVLMKIISSLNLEDVINLGYTCKFMNKLCNDDELWKAIYAKNSVIPENETVEELSKLFGWKRLFFTNKLQLQVIMHTHDIQ